MSYWINVYKKGKFIGSLPHEFTNQDVANKIADMFDVQFPGISHVVTTKEPLVVYENLNSVDVRIEQLSDLEETGS